VIDDHAHPFPLTFSPLDLSRVSLGPSGAAGDGRLWVELLTTRLAALLGVDADDAPEARDEAAQADWSKYVRTLLDDAHVEGLVIDPGVSVAGGGSGRQLADVSGRPVWELARVDPLVDQLIEGEATAREIIDAVESFMADAAAGGAVGFKTIVAYRTGLAVDPEVSVAGADADLHRGADVPVRRRGKVLRDLVIGLMLERAADHGLPVQVHTGFGDSDIRLREANPLLLEDLLRSPAGRRATVVLIHGSYPWHEELAYLATVHPNVYAEISLFNLFAPLRVADRLGRMLELAPPAKLLAGSDGHLLPETHWFACRILHEAFSVVGRELASAGARNQWVESTCQAVLSGNARRIYRLVP
jgi:predicted TIM-barrel fold metal-dependent hydrolase